jgi:hypothetical protein
MKMTTTYKRITSATALCLIFAVTQMCIGISSAKLDPPTDPLPPEPPPITGILKTNGNRPINVNGTNAGSGATIMTGSLIETPDQVGGTISLGSLSNLEIAPNTKLRIDFDQDGNVKVTLVRGCATVRTKKNVLGEVDTEQGVAGKTDPKSRGLLNVCFPLGAAAPTVIVGAGATAAAGSGLFDALLVVFGASVGTGVIVSQRGANPSPSSP